MKIEMRQKIETLKRFRCGSLPEGLNGLTTANGLIASHQADIRGAGACDGQSGTNDDPIVDLQIERSGGLQYRDVGRIDPDMGISGDPMSDLLQRDGETFSLPKVSDLKKDDNRYDNLNTFTRAQGFSTLRAQARVIRQKPNQRMSIENEDHQILGKGLPRYFAPEISSNNRSTFPFHMPQRSAKWGTLGVEKVEEEPKSFKASLSTLSSTSIPAIPIDNVSRSITWFQYDILAKLGQATRSIQNLHHPIKEPKMKIEMRQEIETEHERLRRYPPANRWNTQSLDVVFWFSSQPYEYPLDPGCGPTDAPPRPSWSWDHTCPPRSGATPYKTACGSSLSALISFASSRFESYHGRVRGVNLCEIT